MSPAPDQERAKTLLQDIIYEIEPEEVLLFAAARNLLKWDPNYGTIEVRNPDNTTLEYQGIYTYPQFLQKDFHIRSIGFGSWGPITKFGLDRSEKQLAEVFGVKLEINTNTANIKTVDGKFSAELKLEQANEITGEVREILSAFLLLPQEAWNTASRCGFAHLKDPSYPSTPLVMGLYLPDASGYLRRSFDAEEYVANKEWSKYGKPVVVYGKY